MTSFERELLNLKSEIDTPTDKTQLMNDCVYDRLSDILNVQSACFDDALGAVQSAINVLDLHNVHNLKKFNRLFKNLYHFAGIDRRKIIKFLISTRQ